MVTEDFCHALHITDALIHYLRVTPCYQHQGHQSDLGKTG